MRHTGEISAYVLCDSNSTPVQEIGEGNFFASIDEAKAWIKDEDPLDEFEWRIYSVDVVCEYITSKEPSND